MTVLAVIFDFDDTLAPDSTSALIEKHGMDPDRFWREDVKALLDQGYDPPLAYLNLLLDNVGPDRPLGALANRELAALGASLDDTWFAGLPQIFDELRLLVSEHRDTSIEFYIISGGLQAIIQGSAHVQKHFRAVYGCQLGEVRETETLGYIKRCVTFTEKTRFLFEISKGISPEAAATKPHLVNELVPLEARPVPFKNMIYVGDGLTDIPCFSLIRNGGGTTFGVFQPGRESARQAFQQFLNTGRVHSMHRPDYHEDGELGAMLRAAVSTTASRIALDSQRPI